MARVERALASWGPGCQEMGGTEGPLSGGPTLTPVLPHAPDVPVGLGEQKAGRRLSWCHSRGTSAGRGPCSFHSGPRVAEAPAPLSVVLVRAGRLKLTGVAERRATASDSAGLGETLHVQWVPRRCRCCRSGDHAWSGHFCGSARAAVASPAVCAAEGEVSPVSCGTGL